MKERIAMTIVELKKPITDEIRKTMNSHVAGLMLGERSSHGLLNVLWRAIQESSGCIDTAYQRGYLAGEEAAEKKMKARQR